MTGAANPAARRRENWLLAAMGALGVLPLLVYHAMFARLFWFGDEFDLIDQFDRMGFWRWVWLVFAENFVPLFKVLWGGAVFASGGAYWPMIVLLWLTHGLTVAWLGRLLRACGLGWTAVLAAQLIFGLAPTNYETLAWSVQWSAVLALTFQLMALDRFFRSGALGGMIAESAASALSFSRGVLTGLLVAWAAWLQDRRAGRWRRMAGLVAPSVVVAVLITLLAVGNHNHMHGHLAAAATYGLWYFCLNPVYTLLAVGSWGWRTTLILGALKLGLFGWAICRSRDASRALFLVLLAFDLGNATLLGIGRFHTGILTVVSSRYQYGSLVAILPVAGFMLDYWSRRTRLSARVRSGALVAAAVSLGAWLLVRWPSELDGFTTQRGTDSRQLLLVAAAPPPYSVPGIPFMPVDRARELIAKYNLH